jgi:hypothetical protein
MELNIEQPDAARANTNDAEKRNPRSHRGFGRDASVNRAIVATGSAVPWKLLGTVRAPRLDPDVSPAFVSGVRDIPVPGLHLLAWSRDQAPDTRIR